MPDEFLAFLSDLDPDLQKGLKAQLRTVWTHHSTVLEGNTLTLGETEFVLGEGLTVSGKPLKDHQQVVGHAQAIDLVFDWIVRGHRVEQDDLFRLHQAVQKDVVTDALRPTGAYKLEPNGTNVVIDGQPTFNDTYAYPQDVAPLMQTWLAALDDQRRRDLNQEDALDAYVWLHAGFVRVHPFADGNGRMARLLANLPVLEAGLPPIVVPKEQRHSYLRTLAEWQVALGRLRAGDPLASSPQSVQPFRDLCRTAWKASLDLVDAYRAKQRERDASR